MKKRRFAEIVTYSIFGHPIKRLGTVLGYKHCGFDTKGGGWGAYKITDTCTPAWFAVVRWKGKRKSTLINLRDIVSIRSMVS